VKLLSVSGLASIFGPTIVITLYLSMYLLYGHVTIVLPAALIALSKSTSFSENEPAASILPAASSGMRVGASMFCTFTFEKSAPARSITGCSRMMQMSPGGPPIERPSISLGNLMFASCAAE
jgi:hypothetical protein